MANTYYQFGPRASDYGGRLGGFRDMGFSDIQREYYMANPDAQFQLALSRYPTSGGGLVAPRFRQYVERWMPDQYKRFQGRAGMGDPNASFFLKDYLPDQEPYGDYLRSNPYANDYARYGRPTRLLRR